MSEDESREERLEGKLRRALHRVSDLERELKDEQYDHDKTKDLLRATRSEVEDRDRKLADMERERTRSW